MPEEWFYAQDGATKGPVSGAELRALAQRGDLLPDDFIWKEGLDDWVPASRTKGLFPDAPAGAPPAGGPGMQAPAPADQGAARTRPRPSRPPPMRESRRARALMEQASEPPKRPWTYWAGIGGAGLVFAVLLIVVWPAKLPVGPAPDEEGAAREPSLPDRAYVVGNWDWVFTSVDGKARKLYVRCLEDTRFDMYLYPEEGGDRKKIRWGTWRIEGDHLIFRGSKGAERIYRPRIVDKDTMQLTAGDGTCVCRRSAAGATGAGAAPEGSAPPGGGAAAE